MSERKTKIGIYVAFHPRTVLRGQGLATYIRQVTLALLRRADSRIVIACPTWLRADLQDFLGEHGGAEQIEFITPKRRMLAFVVLDFLQRFRSRLKRFRLRRSRRLVQRFLDALNRGLIAMGSATNPIVQIVALCAGLALAAVLAIPILIAWLIVILVQKGLRILAGSSVFHTLQGWRLSGASEWRPIAIEVRRFTARLFHPIKFDLADVGFRIVEVERQQLIADANQRKDIAGWLVPTAFWPEVESLNAPYALIVPDVVFREVPVKFAELNERTGSIAEQIDAVASRAANIVTFSRSFAQSYLVGHLNKSPASIHVVPHGTTTLDHHIRVMNQPLRSFAVDKFASQLMLGYRDVNLQASEYLRSFSLDTVDFLFYAAQARPNKNLITLLKAYAFALREKYIYQKLIITADLGRLPEVNKYLHDNRLQYDVIAIPQASEPLLAALYYKSTLAICPSLFEGGFPFTFVEAISVGTPVLMARIAVVTVMFEAEPDLMSAITFDPFDTEALAEKIAWGVKNRAELFALEKPFYDSLAKRTWDTVAQDYVDLFTRLADDRSAGRDKPDRLVAGEGRAVHTP